MVRPTQSIFLPGYQKKHYQEPVSHRHYNESEKFIQQSLEELAKDRTTITIAHRLSTIRNADEILVVAENGIAERGTHDELLAKGGIYAHYYEMS